MRKYIIIALVLLAIGVGVSLYVIPTANEVASMQNRDIETVDLGNVDIEAEYAQGRRTFPIINALADKRVAAGDRPAAIALLEEYVTANPADVKGRKKLAEQYQLAGNNEAFNQQLEAIAAADPTEPNLRVLSDIYNTNKDYVKQAEVLKKIVEVTKGEKPEAFVDLATIQVATGDTAGALATVEQLKAKHPTFSSYPMTRIMVGVLAEKGEVDRAFTIAKEWIATPNAPVPAPVAAPTADGAAPAVANDPRPRELADLCNILNYSGHPDKAVALVEPHTDMLDREPELVVAYINANINVGRADHAYAVLQRFDEAGKMTPGLWQPYLDLALKREDMAAAEAIATKMDVTVFTEEQALNLLEVARAHSAESVLATLTTRFSDAAILADKPVLAAVIAILTGDKAQDTKIEAALNGQLASTQRLRLAEACARAKKTPCFEAILKQFPTLDEMAPSQIAEYAQLFIIADRAGELVDPVGAKAALPNSHADVQTAHRRLAAAAGRFDVLKPWLEANANRVPVAQLQELFYLANDRRHGEVSSDIAERLYARDPSPMNRDIMISAYITAGAYEKAMPMLREQIKDTGANDGLYLSTLSKLARKDAAARKELADYAEASLRAGRGDARQQINYAYVMINNGRKDAVIPIAKSYADERGGEWKKMYAQLTQRTSAKAAATPVKLSREQMVAMAGNPGISNANKRQIAFNLLNDGYKNDAMEVFKDLAKDKGPDSQEVKDLLYLWGGKLNDEQLTWVQARAATASPYDRERWSNLIQNSADDRSLMAYVSATPEALYNKPLRQKYFGIIAATGNRNNYDTAMRNWVSETTDVPALLDYASIGQQTGFREAAINGYNRVLALDPNNAKALSQLAVLDFGKAKYSSAEAKLDQYMAVQQQQPDPETSVSQAHFYKAELLRRQGNKEAAMAEYARVVDQTSQAGAPDELSRKYTAQFHLGQHDAAKAGFDNLLAQYPDNKGILADYMSALIMYNYTDEATRVANRYDRSSPYYRGSALQGRSANVASIERFSDGREMKITFDRAIEDDMPMPISAADQLAWVEGTDVGYDTVTISAKPGYVVRYVPTAQEQFAVVPQATPNYAPQVEEQRQQDLRLQLLYAKIEQDSGQMDKAQARVNALKPYYPNDPQLLSYEATLASASGDRRQALALVREAQAQAPENENLAYLEREFSRAPMAAAGSRGAQYVKADVEHRNYGAHDELITTASGSVRLTDSTEAGFMWQHDAISPDGMLIPETGGGTDGDADRDQYELSLTHYLDSGDSLKGAVFGDNKTIGGGAYYGFANSLGRTELLGEYHKPYWDYAQAVYAYANRDRVGLRHYASIDKKTSVGIETSVNNYNIEFDDDQVQTALVRASFAYEVQPQTDSQPYLGLGYGFDGEYKIDDHEVRSGVFGEYQPFDWRSREVHYFSGTYRDDWTPTTHAMLNAGYAVDRLNEDGPVVEGHIRQDLSDDWELGVRARYGVITNGSSDGDNDAVNLGTHLMYKF
jgi:TolA-binding protein